QRPPTGRHFGVRSRSSMMNKAGNALINGSRNMKVTSVSRRMAIALGSAFAVTLLTLGQASAQSDYPNRDITFVVPYSPGASGDILSRKYTALLGEILNTAVVVSNVPGGSGTIGTVEIFGAEPDGYTIGYGHNSPLA